MPYACDTDNTPPSLLPAAFYGGHRCAAIRLFVRVWCVVAQVASVGLSEEDAKAKGLDYKTGKFAFMANSRARAVNDTDGLVRVQGSWVCWGGAT
jgi:pyruvate/2-oxoglutarate dehydrogenase complex dihydrolipoamide dehydrogenase (E3) component